MYSGIKSTIRLARMFLSVWSARRLGTRVAQIPLLYLDVIDRCNSRCRSCDVWRSSSDAEPELTTDEILALRPAARKLKTQIVSFGGGEPTLRDDLETCIRAFHEDGMSVHMNSNGLSISAERARSLVDAGLSVVYLSIDHPEPEGYRHIRGVDGYERAVRAIEHFRSLPQPIPVGVNMVVSSLNQDVIEQQADKCIAWGVTKAQFIPVHTHLRHRGMARELIEPLVPKREDLPAIKDALQSATAKLREAGIETNSPYFIRHFDRAYDPVRSVPCMAGTLFVSVNPFGYVVPCYQQEHRLNVRDMPLDEIVQGPEYRELCRCVSNCSLACWDTGSAETSIRFCLRYLATHPLQIYEEARLHLNGRDFNS